MKVYFIAIVICCILCILEEAIKLYYIKISNCSMNTNKFRISIFYSVSCFILVFLAIVRADDIGVDIINYKAHFMDIKNIGIRPQFEISYYLINKIILKFNGDFNSLLIVCSLLTLIPMLYVIKKENKKYIWISIFLFITMQYVSSFSILRAYLSLSCIFIAYTFINKKNKKKIYWLFMALAISFHYSSLIYVFLFWIGNKKYNYFHFLFTNFLGLIVSIPAVGWLIQKTITIIGTKYSVYLYQKPNLSVVYIFIFTILSILCLIYYRKLIQRNIKNIILVNLTFIMLLFNLYCTWFPAYSRVVLSVNSLLVLLIPEIVACEKNKIIRMTYQVSIIAFFVIYFLVNVSDSSFYRFK